MIDILYQIEHLNFGLRGCEMMYTKQEVIGYIWQYSRYYGNLLIACEEIAKLEHFSGHARLIYLFNILENIVKSQIKNYELNFVQGIDRLKEKCYISEIVCDFLNNKEYGIRKIRNLLAHSNLSKYIIGVEILLQ